MKKMIMIIAAVTIMSNTANAQDSNEPGLRERVIFGLKVGTNLSNVYDEQGNNFSADSKLGLATGAFVSIPLGRFFGIQPEVLFSQKGFHATGSILGSSYNLTRTTNYIDVPLLITLKPSRFLSIVAGPQYSYLTKRTDVFESGSTTIEQQTEFSNDNIYKNTLCFTGGLDINVRHFVLGLRAGWDVQSNKENGSSTTPRYKNVWYQGTIGFRFY